MIVTNKHIAIKPLKHEAVKSEIKGGLAVIQQKRNTVDSSIVFGYENKDGMVVTSGDTAILLADSYLQPWNKAVYSRNGLEFVLCPIDQIVAFDIK